MPDLKQIDVAATAKLFEELHVKPVTYNYLDKEKSCGCLIGVLIASRLGKDDAFRAMVKWMRNRSEIYDLTGLDRSYAEGLDRGFTQRYPDSHRYSGPLRVGIEDGMAVRVLVSPDVFPKPWRQP